jgi:hypothetical protein
LNAEFYVVKDATKVTALVIAMHIKKQLDGKAMVELVS